MLLDVREVMECLGISQSGAYNVIRDLNNELKERGFLTIRGKVEERYLHERFRLSGAEGLNKRTSVPEERPGV